MGFCLLAYQGTPGVNAASFDLTAVTDPDFSTRNGHFLFTEQYRLLAAAHLEANALRANFSCPTWNALGKPNIWPVNNSATPPSPGPPKIDSRAYAMPPVPLREEFQFQVTNNLGTGTEQAYGFVWLVTTDWNRNLPAGQMPIMVRCTAGYTPPALAWSGPQNLTFEQSLRGGVYAVVGAEVLSSGTQAFRLIFPRYRLYQGRKLRPGWLCQQAVGDELWPLSFIGPQYFGEWGRFHSEEPLMIETLQTASSAITPDIRLWLQFVGEDLALLQQGLGGGGIQSAPQIAGGYAQVPMLGAG